MGKSGALLREQKKKAVTYVFTKEQLEEHDSFIRKQTLKDCEKVIDEMQQKMLIEKNKEIDEYITKKYDNIEKYFGECNGKEKFLNTLSCLMSASASVLVEHFGFKPLNGSKMDNYKKLSRFCELLIREIEHIGDTDVVTDIKSYCDLVYQKCGVIFKSEEVDE